MVEFDENECSDIDDEVEDMVKVLIEFDKIDDDVELLTA